MKLIMENWRNYQDIENSLMLFESQINEEIDILISEGVMDLVSSAYEKAKTGALKIKDTLSDSVKAALQKVNDFFLKMTIKAMQLAKTSIDAMMRVVGSMNSAIERFQNNHPILYKIVKVTIFMIVMAGVMAIFSSEASAKITMDSGNTMSQDRYNTIRGLLSSYMDNKDVSDQLDIGSAIKDLDIAFKSKSPESIKNLDKYVKAANNVVSNMVDTARSGDRDTYSDLMKYKKIGEKLRLSYNVVTLGTGGAK